MLFYNIHCALFCSPIIKYWYILNIVNRWNINGGFLGYFYRLSNLRNFLTKCAFAMTNFRNDYSNIPNDMHGLIVKIYISQSTSINKFIHKIFLLYEWTGKMLICLEDKCTRLIIRYRKLQLSNLIISLNLNLATKLTVCTAKHVRRSFDIVLMSLDAPVFNRCGFVYQ